jgi:hypothetical protein
MFGMFQKEEARRGNSSGLRGKVPITSRGSRGEEMMPRA